MSSTPLESERYLTAWGIGVLAVKLIKSKIDAPFALVKSGRFWFCLSLQSLSLPVLPIHLCLSFGVFSVHNSKMMAAETREEIATMSQRSPAQNSLTVKAVTCPNLDARYSPEDGDDLKTLPQENWQDQPITYQYLTFETPLPPGCPARRPGGASPTIPPFPDISQYASPFLWSSARKTVTLILCCAATLCAAYSAGAYFMPSAALERKWGLSTVAFNSGVTTWAVGFALSPMVLAPFSELTGRKPVFTGSGILFVVALLGCALTDSFAGMLVARFLVGAGASTFATMVGGVISDIYHSHERNTPMALYSGSALAGTGLGPMVSGFIAEQLSWRWVFWMQVIVFGVVVAVVILFFRETRGSVLLSRKADALNAYLEQREKAGVCCAAVDVDFTHPDAEKERWPVAVQRVPRRLRFKVATDENRSSVGQLIYLSLTTPFHLLFTEPVIFFFSLWAAFAWGVLYMSFDDIPLVFAARGFAVDQVGAVYGAIAVGSILGAILSIYQEKVAQRYWENLTTTPEGRLYFACVESALLPLGLFWFGWTSFPGMPWIVPALALGCAQIGIFSIYLAVFNYLADVYHRYASSALAAQSFCRNMLAAIFPLFTEAMFRRLGTPGASSLLGGVSALLTVVRWVLVFLGPRIRKRSRVASEILVHGTS
jgi:multidrug resistance protein